VCRVVVRSHGVELAITRSAGFEHVGKEPFFEDVDGAEVRAVVEAVAENGEGCGRWGGCKGGREAVGGGGDLVGRCREGLMGFVEEFSHGGGVVGWWGRVSGGGDRREGGRDGGVVVMMSWKE